MKICLITRSYPSNDVSEKNFVFPEIIEHLKHGHQITLLPLSLSADQDVSLPESITVNETLAKKFKGFSLLISITGLIFNNFFWKEIFSNCSKIFTHPTRLVNFFKYSVKKQSVLNSLKTCTENYDVIYTYWCSGETAGAIEFKNQSSYPVKIITRAHGYDIYEERACNKGYLPYRQYIINELDKFIVLSDSAKKHLLQKYEAKDEHIYVSPLGVQNQTVSTTKNDNDSYQFFSCSFPAPVKRLPLIYNTLRLIAEKEPSKKIVWTHFGATEKDISISNIPENMTVELQGPTDKAVILKSYIKRNSNAYFINLSSSEGQPVSVMEAMSCGLPIIATNVGGLSEMLGDTGLLLNVSNNEKDMSDSIINFTSDTDYVEQAKKSLELQQTYFNETLNHSKLSQVISDLK